MDSASSRDRKLRMRRYCFDALNMPAEHPARDMQDTLYLTPPVRAKRREDDLRTLLRARTPPPSRYAMKTHQLIRADRVPGRVYWRDDLDLTHSRLQVEALVGDGI
jgi:phenylalanyl-tRNA synthetase alpha chain